MFLVITISCTNFAVESWPEFSEDNEGSHVLFKIETVCIGAFTIEYLIRVFTADDLRDYALKLINIVDLLAIVPYYIDLIIILVLGDASSNASILAVLRSVRLTRVFRVFKVSKYSETLSVVWVTMGISVDALQTMAVLLAVCVLIFSFLMYAAEMTESEFCLITEQWIRADGKPSPFQSIPHCFWWAIVTLITVGYGDDVPISNVGKLVGALTMLTGPLVIAFPTILVGFNFSIVHQRYKEEAKRRRLQLEAHTKSRGSVDKTEKSDGTDEDADMVRAHTTVPGKLWAIFEPGSYCPNHTYEIVQEGVTLFSFCLILLSVGLICLESMPAITAQERRGDASIAVDLIRTTEFAILCYFTFEFLLRMFVCPSLKTFWKDTINWIDLVSILPSLIGLVIEHFFGFSTGLLTLLVLTRILRLGRAAKAFKLSKYNRYLSDIVHTMQASVDALWLMVCLLAIGLLLFSSCIFVVESNGALVDYDRMKYYRIDPDTGDKKDIAFQHIPASFWWSVVTMTTVGYGDQVPSTLLGKLIGVACMLSGILVLAFPIIIIGGAFEESQKKYLRMGDDDDEESDDESDDSSTSVPDLEVTRPTFSFPPKVAISRAEASVQTDASWTEDKRNHLGDPDELPNVDDSGADVMSFITNLESFCNAASKDGVVDLASILTFTHQQQTMHQTVRELRRQDSTGQREEVSSVDVGQPGPTDTPELPGEVLPLQHKDKPVVDGIKRASIPPTTTPLIVAAESPPRRAVYQTMMLAPEDAPSVAYSRMSKASVVARSIFSRAYHENDPDLSFEQGPIASPPRSRLWDDGVLGPPPPGSRQPLYYHSHSVTK